MKIKVNRRELATILAALRWWQSNLHWVDKRGPVFDIANDGNSVTPLNRHEIENLCQRINTERDAQESV